MVPILARLADRYFAIFRNVGLSRERWPCALWISSLNVKYRDFRHVIPFIVQFGLYASPVGFSSSVVPPQWRILYSLNPMVGVIDGFRWCLLRGQTQVFLPAIALSITVGAAFLWFGIRQFRKSEKSFADLI